MTEKRFYSLAGIALIAMIAITFLGEYFSSVSLLFNILLAFVGVVAGFLTNQYFAEKSDKQNLGKHAFSGYRMSGDISTSIDEIIKSIEGLKGTVDDTSRLSKKEVGLMFDVVTGQLAMLQRISLLANSQWKDVLPKEEQRTINLSTERKLRITAETFVSEELALASRQGS